MPLLLGELLTFFKKKENNEDENLRIILLDYRWENFFPYTKLILASASGIIICSHQLVQLDNSMSIHSEIR